MSRNLTINQIAPHITSASVPGVDTSNNVPAFSPYISRSQEQHAEEQTDREQTEKKQPASAASSKKQQGDTEPEIFKLISLPDFSDFFALANGKDGAEMMFIVKNIRTQRGVTKSLPVSNSRVPAQRDALTYLKTEAHFMAPKGTQFTGKI